MCRLTAYCGPSIPLENIIALPCHSLIVQSQEAEEAKLCVNGDGFGIAWYGEGPEPALYKEIMPAWANPNLQNISRSVQSGNFIAHVRASTFGGASYQNCHPFTHKKWAFAHNGQLGGFEVMRRSLEALLPDHLYHERVGVTDSELLFLLIVAGGLEKDPNKACRDAIEKIEIEHRKAAIVPPLRLTFVLSDGEVLIACRYSSDGKAPTLYQTNNLDHGGKAFASEPLDGCHDNWAMVPEGEIVVLNSPQSGPRTRPGRTQIAA